MARKTSLSQLFSLSLILVMAAVTYYFANSLIQRAVLYKAGAAGGNAEFFFDPGSLTLPPDGLASLWVTTDKAVGFVRAELSFDPKLVALAQDITLAEPSLKRVIKLSTMSEANSSGKIILVVAVDPTTLASAPTGNIKLANFKFKAISTRSNKAASVTVSTSSSQLVDTSAVPFNLTAKGLSLTVNPSDGTSTPTPTPTPATTPTPPPISSDNIAPTVSFTSPTGGSVVDKGSTLSLTATAQDNVGIVKVDYFVNDSLICTTSSPTYTCEYKTNKGKAQTYDLKVVASDAGGNTNSATLSVSTQ